MRSAIRLAGRSLASAGVLAAAVGVGVLFGPHRDGAEAAFDGVLASMQLPVAIPGGAVMRAPVRGGTLRRGGIDFYPGRTEMRVAALFDYYEANYRVLTREERDGRGTVVFMRADGGADVEDVDALGAQMYVLQAFEKPEAEATGFVLAVPRGDFRLRDYARAEFGEAVADGAPSDLPGPPGSERLFSVSRPATRHAEQRMALYRVAGDPRDVLDFYRTAMVREGWQRATSGLADQGFLFFQKGGRIAQIAVEASEDGGEIFATVNYVGRSG